MYKPRTAEGGELQVVLYRTRTRRPSEHMTLCMTTDSTAWLGLEWDVLNKNLIIRHTQFEF